MSMKLLITLHEGPYSNERSYNGLRTGLQFLSQVPGASLYIYLFSDSVACVAKNQKPSAARYNTGDLVLELLQKGASIKLCKSCLEARAVSAVIEGVEISNLKEYTNWITTADKHLSF
jgi:uncharacterized protein involved in oxidation of intracellular sulfur